MAALGLDISAAPRPRRAAVWLARAGELALPAAAIALLFAAWEWGVALLGIGAYLLPPPSQVLAAIAAMARDGSLSHNTQVTLGATLGGFAIALAAGIAVGGLIAQSRLVERTVYGYLVAIQTLPKIALAPLFVAWFGFGLSSKVAVAALIAFFPIVVNVIVGLKSCDAGRIDVMRALSASRWQIFRHVQLPSALPFIMAGADVAIVFALTGAIVGEFVGATAGLGYQMVLSNSQMQVPKVYGVLIVLGGLGMLLHGAVALLRRRLLSWMPSSPSRLSHS
nr:ABC transporter permease [Variovorax boronicumulans]